MPNKIIVVGGGFIGPALVHMLRGKFAGSIIHIAPPAQQIMAAENPLDVRATALSYASFRILETLGLWPTAAHSSPSPINEIHVSQQGAFGSTRMQAAPYPALGYVVENHVLQQQLHCEPTHTQNVTAASRSADGIAVTLADGSEIEGDLLVVADGAQSATAQMAGFAYESVAHTQMAIASNVRLHAPHHGLAIERFTDEGPVALLPLANQGPDVCSLVLCRKQDNVAAWQAKSDTQFMQDLSALFNGRVSVAEVGSRQAFPLQSHRTKSACVRDAVVIGNAAQALHPVAGQGFNLGLRDAAALAELLVDNRYSGDAYTALRAPDRRKIWHTTNTLASLFLPTNGPLPWARGVGLLGLDIGEKLGHHRFKQQAMGLGGWQSKLARGLAL